MWKQRALMLPEAPDQQIVSEAPSMVTTMQKFEVFDTYCIERWISDLQEPNVLQKRFFSWKSIGRAILR